MSNFDLDWNCCNSFGEDTLNVRNRRNRRNRRKTTCTEDETTSCSTTSTCTKDNNCEERIRAAFCRGLREGRNEGRRNGFCEGREAGLRDGIREGRRKGFCEGKRVGLREGFCKGKRSCRRNANRNNCDDF